MTDVYEQDKTRIRDIITKLFDDLSWDENSAPDWSAFKKAFRNDAVLYPSARPVAQKPMLDFVDGMEGARTSGDLKSIVEAPLAFDITVFGNTALAYTSYKAEINGGAPGRGANAFLFVKDDGQWKIGAMAWDNESEAAPFCSRLAGN